MAWIHPVAGILGFTAVAASAYGAHGLPKDRPDLSAAWGRAASQHLIHALLIVAAPMTKRPALVAGLAATGVLMFAGSCYAYVLTDDRAWSKLAPIGGFALMAAWLALI
mmetsp:Transcript_2610/g.4447  ORF Transcript_2610/g.4447 Transcript_2610/m.4447 type:complete len:109 (-) Transcript_2610:322-648(-)|eukprot:CAMPEP_0119101628 /NCGR_PEP_ID=MMETSP1180-20130426/631_1 /TAXON_ID=3052 ORGANISM="Chlamydomonas cf sp, Strain CCMP681" /NCGR_SAMPLE_ID=MMETSP1180 /ASSEMBLY_ACC=CAM_ASM_000741 /LENGTH=108 /DNA_ID=CAMNT_0007085777 /DNA_START=74 /DNA_END=400 /DNA_ORIENTATION=+